MSRSIGDVIAKDPHNGSVSEAPTIHGNGGADAPGKEIFDSFHQLALDLEVNEQPSKRCSVCRLRYPLHGFNRDGRSSDGLQANCRGCAQQRTREYETWHQQTHGCSPRTAWQRANRERSNAWHRARRARLKADSDPTDRNLESALKADREYRDLLTEQGARRRRNSPPGELLPPIES